MAVNFARMANKYRQGMKKVDKKIKDQFLEILRYLNPGEEERMRLLRNHSIEEMLICGRSDALYYRARLLRSLKGLINRLSSDLENPLPNKLKDLRAANQFLESAIQRKSKETNHDVFYKTNWTDFENQVKLAQASYLKFSPKLEDLVEQSLALSFKQSGVRPFRQEAPQDMTGY